MSGNITIDLVDRFTDSTGVKLTLSDLLLQEILDDIRSEPR